MHIGHITLRLFWGAVICAFGPIAHAQSLDQQERCAQQAKRAYTEKDAQDRADMQKMGTGHSRAFGDFQSHYNVKLGNCLMLVETTDMSGSEFIKTAYITDANERRLYAIYVWMSKEGKKYWEVPPMSCDLIVSMLEKRACKTREEFDAFVAPYMEE
jgi:hypothetical protein